ncbi:MAG: hypothetical protein KF740_16350 [Ramlibacter sp.]|nr:hypothetical protein [Ramlibacter sp.]
MGTEAKTERIWAAGLRRAAALGVLLALAACGGGGGSKNTVNAGAGNTPVAVPVVIQYLASEPTLIYLAGTAGATRASVKFRLRDALDQVVAGRAVKVELVDATSGVRLEGAQADGTIVLTSDADGLVTAAVLAGSVPAAVRLRATSVDFPALTVVSADLTVAVGRPYQSGLSLAPVKLSIEGASIDGETTDITLSLTDRNGNPVPDGTQVNFVSESGVLIPPSCVVAGGASRCTVTLRSQAPRTSDGRVTVLAYTPGEEDFIDLNGNNRWDAGEPFTDLGQVYRDDNESKTYDAGEFFIPRPGSSACAGGTMGRPNTCDGTWGEADVRASAIVVFATSAARLGDAVSAAGSAAGFVVTVSDLAGNSMPLGTALSVGLLSAGTSSCQAELSLTSIPNTLIPIDVGVRLTGCVAGERVELKATSPSGFVTARTYVLN